jgi:D-amino-acid dehydrogenase
VKNILILGGGSIGLFSAYYLRKSGFEVTVIDRYDYTNGCSFGNAGLIVPSHIIPMASPGYLRSGFKMMFDPGAPLSFKMPPSLDLLKWLTRFYFAATHKHVNRSIPVLKEICLFSQSLLKDIYHSGEIDFKLHEKGLFMLYKTRKMEHEEVEMAKRANECGIKAEVLKADEVRKMEKNISEQVLGGVYYPGDNHLDAEELMHSMVSYLRKAGVKLIENTNVAEIRRNGKTCTELVTDKGNYRFDELVVAAGTWSAELLKKLGVSLALQPGKGYSFKKPTTKSITYPALLAEARIAVSPISESCVRFTSGMDLGYFNSEISNARLAGIENAIAGYYLSGKDEKYDVGSVWQGHRPCSFDGLPYIGTASGFKNVYIATGHSMLGITLGPATGKLISELISGETSSISLTPFLPER